MRRLDRTASRYRLALAILATPVAIVSCNSTVSPGPPVVSPPASAGHAMVFHDALGAVLLVNTGLGGPTSPPSSTHTVLWRWTGQSWVIQDSLGPPIRNLGGVAYDAQRNALVLFGGTYDQNLSYDDTWEWTPSGGWSRKSVTGPGKRDHTEMAYDAARQRVVLFGGQIGTDSFPSDTWTWNGASWQQAQSGTPRGRVHHALVYDPASQHVLMFGGSSPASGDFGDTWSWSGTEWTSAAAAIAPRTHARLGVTSNGVILLGGFPAQSSTVMRLESGVWRAQAAGTAPGPRYLSAMAFDPMRGVTVLFGGGDASSDALLADTWEFSASAGWRLIR